MTLISRFRSFIAPNVSSPAPVPTPTRLSSTSVAHKQPETATLLPITLPLQNKPEPLPDWLIDEELLRDEGVLFGLSDAQPDEKLAQIRAVFAQQSAPVEELIEQHIEKINELNLFIEQRENQVLSLVDQAETLRNSQPLVVNLIRHCVSLSLSIVMNVGNFYLIDQILQPSFPNRWVSVGVFLTGTFNLFGQLSFFYENDNRPSTRRIIEEVGIPVATSLFILSQALQNQSTTLAVGLFLFIFFAFLFSGKLLLSTLTALQTDLNTRRLNRQLRVDKTQKLPVLESDIQRINREIDTSRLQKRPLVTALNHAQAQLTQLNAQRDRLVNMFLSEFELARSLRERLTEQQRKTLMNYE